MDVRPSSVAEAALRPSRQWCPQAAHYGRRRTSLARGYLPGSAVPASTSPTSFQTMIKWPKRLVFFWVAVTAISVFALVRGLLLDGEPRVVYTAFGLLGLASLLLFLFGWIRQSRRR